MGSVEVSLPELTAEKRPERCGQSGEAMVRSRWWTALVLAWLCLVSSYLFVLQAYRFLNLSLGVRDLGFFAQSLWNTLQGSFLAISFYPHAEHLWGGHFYLSHILLIPLYAFWPSPLLLLAIQSVAVGVTGWCLFLLGRLWLSRPWMAAVPVLAYTLHPAVHGAALGMGIYGGYQPDHLIPPLFILTVYHVARHRQGAALACWLLGLTVTEQYAVIWVGLGFFFAIRSGTRSLGIIMAAVSIAWLALATLLVIPYFASGKWPFYFSGFQGLRLLVQPGGSGEAVWQRLVSHVRAMASPFGYLPLLDPFTLITVPSYVAYAAAWESGYSVPLSATSWHNCAIIPVMAVSLLRTLGGISWLGSRVVPRFRERLLVGAVLAATVAPLLVTPAVLLPVRFGQKPRDFTVLPPARRAALDEIRRRIPEGAVLVTDFFTGSWFLNRRRLQLLMDGWRNADYVLVDRWRPLGGLWSSERAALQAVEEEPGTVRVVDREGFLLLRRGCWQPARSVAE